MADQDDLNDSWFDRPGRELRREQLPPGPSPTPRTPEPTSVPDERGRDSLADPWFV